MTNDFIEYWAAARLLMNHGNAYSPNDLLKLQSTVGWSAVEPLVMWNPPWTLPLVLPFGLLDYDTAQLLWFLLSTLTIFLGAQLLWRIYAANPAPNRTFWLALFGFTPVYFVLLLGQIAPLILAGLIGFLLAMRRQAWTSAGACLALATIKPHLLYLLWIVALLWVVRQRQWRVAAGFFLMFAIMAGLPLLFDSQIYGRYLALLADRTVTSPRDWATPTIGTALSALVGGQSGWLRWLPALGGALWLSRYWYDNARQWDWPAELPLVLLVSIASAPFSWTFDYVVLLPAVVQGAVWLSASTPYSWASGHGSSWFYLALGAIVLVGKIFLRNDFWYFGLAPAFLLLYLWVRINAPGKQGQLPA